MNMRYKVPDKAINKIYRTPIKKVIKLSDTLLEVKIQNLPKEEFMEYVKIIKSLPGARFIPKEKVWRISLQETSIEILKNKYYFDCIGLNEIKKIDCNEYKKIKIDEKVLKDNLFPFQKEGIKFLEYNKGKAILADEMGLGKTCQVVSYIELNKDKLNNIIVICPASVKYNWKKEFLMWGSIKENEIYIVNGMSDRDWLGRGFHYKVVIMNYALVDNYHKEIIEKNNWMKLDLVVLDESHFVSHYTTLRTKAVVKVSKKSRKIIAVSGTPIVNRPMEFYTVLNLLKPDLFYNRFAFGMKYCNGKKNPWGGYDFNGASNIKQLHEFAKDVMIRRLKKDVLKDLPDKIRSAVPVEVNEKKFYKYEFAEEDIINYILETEGAEKAEKATYAEYLVKFEKLKQLLWELKKEIAFKWIDDFLESGKKLVLFAAHKKVINDLMENYEKISVKIDGSVPTKNRQKVVEEFQNNKKIKLFIGNIKAAGIGITLTAADSCCFLELPWTPGDLSQAEDRIHRIGQDGNKVVSYFLLVKNTIEEKILEILIGKEKVIKNVLDGKYDKSDENIIAMLLKNLKKF